MSYEDKLNTLMDQLDPGRPIFNLNIRDSYIRVDEESWSANLDGDGFYEIYINKYCRRTFNKDSKTYRVHKEVTINTIQNKVLNRMENMFAMCSPAKAPKRTNVFKSFQTVIRENRSTIDFVNSAFDITEYYYSVTKTDSISHTNNDVHRKNIYQLLSLMEKSYAKRKTPSNR